MWDVIVGVVWFNLLLLFVVNNCLGSCCTELGIVFFEF